MISFGFLRHVSRRHILPRVLLLQWCDEPVDCATTGLSMTVHAMGKHERVDCKSSSRVSSSVLPYTVDRDTHTVQLTSEAQRQGQGQGQFQGRVSHLVAASAALPDPSSGQPYGRHRVSIECSLKDRDTAAGKAVAMITERSQSHSNQPSMVNHQSRAIVYVRTAHPSQVSWSVRPPGCALSRARDAS